MSKDIGIVTLCDENYYPGLLMLHKSVQESYPCNVACYDLGISEEHKVYASSLQNLTVLPLPADPLLERIRLAMGPSPPLAKAIKRVWPLWICPLLIRHAPFRDVIWMDCDVVVLRELQELFEAITQGPVFTPENKAPALTPNRAELYDLLPIHRCFDRLLPTVNAGVSGWRKDRDSAALDSYLLPVERAVTDARVRQAISWHDQGALIWAIQSCALEYRVAKTNEWNLCVDHTSLNSQPIAWNNNFLNCARKAEPNAKILHWNGRQPPWLVRA